MTTRNDTFKNVKLGEVFYIGGNTCCKQTTRTADIFTALGPVRFYFRQNDPVTVG
jgi:hypothetical protein